MTKMCQKLKPAACLECIAGPTTGEMLKFMAFGSTLILYGLLSDKPASNINTLHFIGKSQTIESFLLFAYLNQKTLAEKFEVFIKAERMYGDTLKTEVQKTYGLHEVKEAIDFYMRNQSGGKILFKPSQTNAGEKATPEINLNQEVIAKL